MKRAMSWAWDNPEKILYLGAGLALSWWLGSVLF